MKETKTQNLRVSRSDGMHLPADQVRGVAGNGTHPKWRLRFGQPSDPGRGFDLELSGDMVLGRDALASNLGNLSAYGDRALGISRRHVLLRATDTNVFVFDLGSKNGTRLNGQLLEAETPHAVNDGDILSLGILEFVVSIVRKPGSRDSEDMRPGADLADALTQMAKAITSQLDLDEVLAQALEMAMSLTAAGEASIWLLDERTNELFLEAERGITDEHIRRMRLPMHDTLVGQVIISGQPLQASREPEGGRVKVKTGYMVEALLYVPLLRGNLAFGVLAVAHQEPGKNFTPHDLKLLSAIADFAAIAIQNARLYHQVREADRLKSEMIQNISHEFRTPLQYIMGYGGLLLDEQQDTGTLTTEQRAYVEIMTQQAQKLNWLVENLMTARSADDVVSERGPIEVTVLLNQAVGNASLKAAERGLTLSLQVEDDLPAVLVSPMAIYQVLDNLLSNAFKFTPPGGEVTVRAGLTPSEQKVFVSVADTGIGIPEEAHQRIFDRFYQVDGTTTRQFGGVGLGLAVCKAIVEAHGEAIWVESAPGEGTTFVFTMPVAS